MCIEEGHSAENSESHFCQDHQGEETERTEQNSMFGSAETARTRVFIPCLASAAIPSATLLRFWKKQFGNSNGLSAASRPRVHKMCFSRHLHLSDSGVCGHSLGYCLENNCSSNAAMISIDFRLAPTEQWRCSLRSKYNYRSKGMQFLRFCHFYPKCKL